jgi:RNA polymerase sigma-70 factor (ECF subfamily)
MTERPMASARVETDDELLLRMRSGDEDGFLTLYRRRQAGLFRFALHMSSSMPVLRHLERGRNDVALDTDSDDTAQPELAVLDDPLVDLTRREGIDALRRAVHALPRRYREVVVLCDLEEVDYADAAVALGCPIGTVRSRLHRARGLLLEKLNQERNPRQALGTLKPARCES